MFTEDPEVRDLTPYGYPGYAITEDGWLVNPQGKLLGGNANGQVRLQLGRGLGSEWRALNWLVAKAFLEESPGCIHVMYKDGDSNNKHYTNLEWTAFQKNAGKKRAKVLEYLNNGCSPELTAQETDTTISYVRQVAKDRLRELEARQAAQLQALNIQNKLQ